MDAELTEEEIRALLALEPNATCGFVRLTFVSQTAIAAGGLPAPFEDGRPVGSALYFLVTPGAPVRLHRIRNDQLYHYYLGDPLEVFLLHADGSTERVVVGPDLRNGQRIQLLIPGNTFHTARLIGRRRWFLGASTEWPGVVPADVEIGNLDALAGKYPAIAGALRDTCVSSPWSPRRSRCHRSASQPSSKNGSSVARSGIYAASGVPASSSSLPCCASAASASGYCPITR
jgi:predicted cupin superfamily sugar epimerase